MSVDKRVGTIFIFTSKMSANFRQIGIELQPGYLSTKI